MTKESKIFRAYLVMVLILVSQLAPLGFALWKADTLGSFWSIYLDVLIGLSVVTFSVLVLVLGFIVLIVQSYNLRKDDRM